MWKMCQQTPSARADTCTKRKIKTPSKVDVPARAVMYGVHRLMFSGPARHRAVYEFIICSARAKSTQRSDDEKADSCLIKAEWEILYVWDFASHLSLPHFFLAIRGFIFYMHITKTHINMHINIKPESAEFLCYFVGLFLSGEFS